VLVVHETTSELEMRDLDHLVICRSMKHRQFTCQEGRFAAYFPLDILMVYSPKHTFVVNDNNLAGIGLAPGETICFGSLEFTTDRFGRLSLSQEGNDSGTLFVGMVHNGSPSLHTVLEESSNESDATSGKWGAPDSPAPEGAMW
jgi:hypothetical protein